MKGTGENGGVRDSLGGGEAVLERACLELYHGSLGREASWVGFLICLHHVLRILEVGEGLPCGIMERVALPLHKVLDSGARVSLFQEGLHFILGLTIDDEGRRESVRAPRGVERRGVDVGEELAHMEHIVDLHVGGEIKRACGGGGSLDDREGADVPRLEL